MPKIDYSRVPKEVSRIAPPKKLVKSYRVLGGPGDSLLLNVNDLTELESNYVVCQLLIN